MLTAMVKVPEEIRPGAALQGMAGCDSEPIHIPGAIQPHGALLAVSADTLRVTHASANLAALLGRDSADVLGRPLAEVIGAGVVDALIDSAAGCAAAGGGMQVQIGSVPGALWLQAHRTGSHVCIDIERFPAEPWQAASVTVVQRVVQSFAHAGGVVALCELAVHGLRTLSGYDRVMAYRFGEAGHGEVVAEARQADLEPFLGLRYPASDIPAQARQLYRRQRVGSIADANYTPVPLVAHANGGDSLPLDLTHSALRSVSPVHRAYMRNMGTAASLTIGLVSGAELWGMLVCHHVTPRVAGPALRAAADTIGLVVSLLLAGLDEGEVLAQRLQAQETLRAVLNGLHAPVPLARGFAEVATGLLRLVDAGGALVHLSGASFCLGHTPPREVAEAALAQVLGLPREDLLSFDDLGRRFPALARGTRAGSGVLWLPLAADSDDGILWFRPEQARAITWGGNPDAHVAVDPTQARISPRTSFAAWKELVLGRSKPWTSVDLALARELRVGFQAEVAYRTREALRDSEARLGLLAEHSGVVVVLSDLDGTRRYVSPAAERVLGWRPEQLVGHRADEFTHPDDRTILRDAIGASLRASDGQSSATYRFLRPDGTWLWVDGHARVRRAEAGGGPRDYVVVLRDATERKAAEHRLLEALDRMERMADTDGLTGLANRRYLDMAADREWRRCSRDGLPLSALLVDADRFKLFNDRYGHVAGDDCLRAIAGQLSAAAQRPGDVVARYGGEEFLLLLPGTDHRGALCLAQGLCRRVQALGLAHEGNEGVGVMTVSVGAATARPGDAAHALGQVSALFTAADAAMYRAKRGGRNRAVSADLAPPAGIEPASET